MCGIVGFNWNDKGLLNKILKEISHRGPDDFGKYSDKLVSLGHRRLSILDLSNSGKQPMFNEDETICIVFNGEIYNFKELRNFLENKGHTFKSNTDTEVIIHLYEEEGVNCLNKLIGMFAFCIYDSKKKIFFLARDRIGIKPLYYFNNNEKFIFCSELKGILKDTQIKKNINYEAVSSFLTFRANVNEETILKGIKKLMPGNYLIYNLKSNKLNLFNYWNISLNETNWSKDFFVENLKNLLSESVKTRLQSDVPYGAYLSGGVDSGTIVHLMNKFCSEPIETFSVGFENGTNELDEAKFLSEKLNTNHHELIIGENSIRYLPEIIYHLDEPMSDPTSIPTYLLSKYTKKYCTVILTGEGSDELFGGYPQYKFMKLHKYFIRPIPQSIRKNIPLTIKKIPKSTLNNLFEFTESLGEKGMDRFSNFIQTNNFSQQYLNQVALFNEEEKKELLKTNTQNLYLKYSNYFSKKIVNSSMFFDFKTELVDDLLMKLDKNTMAFAIEGRVPFLDHRIVELASKMPETLKLKGFTRDKFILRKTMNSLPTQTKNRKKKHFFVPINNWFNNELLQLKEDLLSEQYLKRQKIFDYNYIKKINNGFDNSPLFYSRQLWSLISFQIWYKQYIENEKITI